MSEFDDRLPNTFYTTDDGIAMMDELPYSIEAESSVLGALLMDNRAWEQVSDTLKEDDFYRAEHRHIFSVIAEQINKSLTADVITVFEALSRKDLAERVGGILYLNTLAQYVPSSANIRRYATLVRERSVLRQLIEAGTDVVQVARKPKGRSVQEIVDQCEQMIFSVGQKNPGGKTNTFPINDLVVNLLDTIQQRADNPSDVTGLPTGFSDLDRMTTGLQPGDLIVLAARPSMGKTSFAVNIAENVAITEKLPVAIFSMEMGASQLAVRILGSVGRVDQGRLRTGKLEQDDWGRLTEAVEKIQTASIDIDESPGLTPAELRSNARRMARKHGKLGLIVVDYLQLMSGSSGGGGDNRATELGEISRGLKMLAKELQCPVIALSQLNRSVEQRTDKRPLMSDLRESGAIEQDADIIMFIYRDDYYNPESKEPNIAELIIGKQRNGPTGTVKLYFQKALTKFESLASNPEY